MRLRPGLILCKHTTQTDFRMITILWHCLKTRLKNQETF